MTNHKETALAIVERFSDLLEAHGIIIPDEDRPEENDAPIYGTTYGDLVTEIETILEDNSPAVIEAYDNAHGWIKVAVYTTAKAKTLVDDPEYKQALTRAGFPENVLLRMRII